MKNRNIEKRKINQLKGTQPPYITNPVTDNKTLKSGNVIGSKDSDAEFGREFSIENKK